MIEDRNKIATWMMAKGYATGHGDTIEDLLNELEWQVEEREREACAKVCEEMRPSKPEYDQRFYDGCSFSAAAIRARGQA